MNNFSHDPVTITGVINNTRLINPRSNKNIKTTSVAYLGVSNKSCGFCLIPYALTNLGRVG
jgi:hypothetical protein